MKTEVSPTGELAQLFKMDLCPSEKRESMATSEVSRLASATARDGVDTRNKDNSGKAAAGTGETTRSGAGDREQDGSDAAAVELEFLRAKIAALEMRVIELERPSVVHQLSGPMSLLHDIGEEVGVLQSVSDWVGSPFAAIDHLKADHSGKVGELFIKRVCDAGGVTCIYNENINDQDDGTYDVVLNGKRVEIKTARLGKQGGFQHESLRAEGCDYYMFLDIAPSHFYVTVCKKFDMSHQHTVLGRKPHLRKGATDVYKFDFGEANLAKGIVGGITLKVTNTTTAETLVEFLNQQVV